jgi:toxin CptA
MFFGARSSMKSVPAIAFDYAPSRWLLAAIVASMMLAMLALERSGLDLWLKLVLGAAALVYGAKSLHTFLKPPFTHIFWHSSGHWRLHDASSGREQVASLRSATVLGMLIVLTLQFAPKRTLALVLLPDNCDSETKRRLRVRLARADAIGVE